MIYHNVSFKLKKNVSEEQINTMIEKLNALPETISEINLLIVRKNFSDRSMGFGVHLVSTFETKNALNAYIKHPAHINVVDKYIKPLLDELIVSDIEV